MELKNDELLLLRMWPSSVLFFLIFSVFSVGPLLATWSVFFSSGHIQHPHERLSVIFIDLFFTSLFLNFVSGVDCDEYEIHVWRFFITSKVPWGRIGKIEFVSEGKSLAIIKIYYEKALFGKPIKLLLRTFSKEKVLIFVGLLKQRSKNAEIQNIDLLKPKTRGLNN